MLYSIQDFVTWLSLMISILSDTYYIPYVVGCSQCWRSMWYHGAISRHPSERILFGRGEFSLNTQQIIRQNVILKSRVSCSPYSTHFMPFRIVMKRWLCVYNLIKGSESLKHLDTFYLLWGDIYIRTYIYSKHSALPTSPGFIVELCLFVCYSQHNN